MLLQLEAGSEGRLALSDGWDECRRLFPTIFWNLCWHLDPDDLLPSLKHFRLRSVGRRDEGSEPLSEVMLEFVPAARTRWTTVPALAAPAAPSPPQAEASPTTKGASLVFDFGGWVDAAGRFRLREPKIFRNLDARATRDSLSERLCPRPRD